MPNNTIQREDISKIVLEATRRLHFNHELTEESQYGIELTSDKKLKELYYYALRVDLEKLGYTFSSFQPEDCVEATTIKDIVDAVWNDLKNQNPATIS